ncbi:MAG TPA: hypothetical protein VEK07_23925 [Polyangiaceae bacterium]|nr:hypothetical protein [Polyangiaceae bacterium]
MPLALLVAPTDPGAGDAASRREALAWLRGQLARYRFDIVIAGAGRDPQEAIEKAGPTINSGDSVLVHVSGRLVGRNALGFGGGKSVPLGLLTEVFVSRSPADLSFMLELTYDDDPTDPIVPHALLASAIQALGAQDYGCAIFAVVRRSSEPAGRIDFTRAVLGTPAPGRHWPSGEAVLAAMHESAMAVPENRTAADGFLFLRGAPSPHADGPTAEVEGAADGDGRSRGDGPYSPAVPSHSQEPSGERLSEGPVWKPGLDEESGELRAPGAPLAADGGLEADATDPTDPLAPEVPAASPYAVAATASESEAAEADATDPTDPLAPEVPAASPYAPVAQAADAQASDALTPPYVADPQAHDALMPDPYGPRAPAPDPYGPDTDPTDPHAPELRVEVSDPLIDDGELAAARLPADPGACVVSAPAPPADAGALEGIEAAAFRTPLTAAPYRIAFEIHRRQGQTDAALLTAMALEELSAAQAEHQALVDQFRTVGPVRIRAPLDAAAWGALRAPGYDDALAALFAAIEQPAVAVRLDELRAAQRLPALDRNQRLSETSTASVVRSFQWAARVLGIRCPDLYAMDGAPGVAMMCAPEPSTALGGSVLSGRSAKDLAFLAGRHLTYYRPEHHVLLYYPTRESLTELLLATVQVGVAENAPSTLPPAVQSLRARLAQRLGEAGRGPLKQAIRVLDARGGQAKVGAWMRGVELTAARVGLFLCGDLAIATGFLRAQPIGVAELSYDERRGDLTAFCPSRAHVALRARLVATGADDQVAPNGGGRQRVAS